jgi:hypothetical protein
MLIIKIQDDYRLQYVLDLRLFVVIKLPEEDTLVPKHVEVGNEHRLCSVICVLLNFVLCIVLVSVLKVCVCYK